MDIKSFSRWDKFKDGIITIFLIFALPFVWLWGKITSINILGVVFVIGIGGWIFGLYMEPMYTLRIFVIVLICIVMTGLFITDSMNEFSIWFQLWMIVLGIAGYWFAGLIHTDIFTPTEKVYMVDKTIKGNTISYIGSDKMTKVISINNKELLAHYNRFKDTPRLETVLRERKSVNILLSLVGIKYEYDLRKSVVVRDKETKKIIFTIK